MSTRELTCIGCPLGCAVTVTLENGTVTGVAGNTCPRGDAYARKEVTNPHASSLPRSGSKEALFR